MVRSLFQSMAYLLLFQHITYYLSLSLLFSTYGRANVGGMLLAQGIPYANRPCLFPSVSYFHELKQEGAIW